MGAPGHNTGCEPIAAKEYRKRICGCEGAPPGSGSTTTICALGYMCASARVATPMLAPPSKILCGCQGSRAKNPVQLDILKEKRWHHCKQLWLSSRGCSAHLEQTKFTACGRWGLYGRVEMLGHSPKYQLRSWLRTSESESKPGRISMDALQQPWIAQGIPSM